MGKRYAVAALAVVILGGCATAPEQAPDAQAPQSSATAPRDINAGPRPDWVDGESAAYPRLQYITSRTHGDTPEQARRQARANLAGYLLVDIEAIGMSRQQAADAAGYQPDLTHMAPDANTVAAASAGRVLQQIEVASEWLDRDNARYHALAVLPRNSARGFLQTQITHLDTQTREHMKQARSAPDPFVQAGRIAMAWRAQQIRAALQASMQRVDLTGRGIAPEFNLSLLRQDAENLLTTLQIQPAGSEGAANAEQVMQLIRGGLVTQDLRPASDNADYIMRGSLTAAVIGERNGWALGHGKLELELSDKVTGQPLGRTTWEVEVPGLDEHAAIRRVYEKTEYMLKVRMRAVLMEMAMNLQ